MSDQPTESGWSLPSGDGPPLPPPTPAVPVAPPPHPGPMQPPAFPMPSSTPLGAAPLPAPLSTPPGVGRPPDRHLPGPLTADQFSAITPDPIPEPTPLWKRWWFIATVLLVIVGGGALAWANSREENDDSAESRPDGSDDEGDDATPGSDETAPTNATDDATDDTDLASVPSSPDISVSPLPDLTAPVSIPAIPGPEVTTPISIPTLPTFAPDPSGVASVGETVTIADGTSIRVNAVTPGVTTQSSIPPDPGKTVTRIAYEACAGSNGFSALNSLYWIGTLDDSTQADPYLFGSSSIVLLQLAPGACVTGDIDFQAPTSATITTVAVRDTFYQIAATWDAATTAPPGAPLTAVSPVAAVPIGQPIALANGATATVRAVDPAAGPLEPSFPPDPGRQFVQIDVEVCAGSTPVSSTAQNWFGATTDGRIGAASFFGSTFTGGTIAAGTCDAGLIDLDLPEGTTVVDVIISNEATVETGRWRVG